jgi:hypothetical protein
MSVILRYTLGLVLFTLAMSALVVFLRDKYAEERRIAVEKASTAPALDYGPPGSVYLSHSSTPVPKPEVPTFTDEGGPAWVCFNQVTWIRPLRLKSKVYFLTDKGKRIDYDDRMTVHYIEPAAQMGPLQEKCRAWVLPAGLPAGEITMAGTTAPADPEYKSHPILLPPVKIHIVAAPQ